MMRAHGVPDRIRWSKINARLRGYTTLRAPC